MNKIRIDTGLVEVEVNDNGDKISFIPDVRFIERFEILYREIDVKIKEFRERENELKVNTELDQNGISVNIKEQTALLKEVCVYCEQSIDNLFGADSCKKALGQAMMPDLYAELLESLIQFAKFEREKKVKKYMKK